MLVFYTVLVTMAICQIHLDNYEFSELKNRGICSGL